MENRDEPKRTPALAPLRSFADFERFLASFTNYEKSQAFHRGSEALRIERMRSLARALGDPHSAYPSVHIAGTKGKGTTSLILEALLRREGIRTGTYTSPHLEHLCERIRVDGRRVAPDRLVGLANGMLPELEARRSRADGSFPSFFELMTALAMLEFREAAVDWAIFEVGLGGRLDATNILEPRFTAITSIALEHTRILGPTVRHIAREKAGIVKPGVPLVLGRLDADAREEVLAAARRHTAPVMEVPTESTRVLEGGFLLVPGFDAPLPCGPIRGPGLRADLALALALAKEVLALYGRKLEARRAAEALEDLTLPGRVEFFAGKPPVVLDGAHTAESARALRAAIEESDWDLPATVVAGLARDKPARKVLGELLPIAGEFVFCLCDAERGTPPARLRDEMGHGDVIEDPQEALNAALAKGRLVVVTGSMYLAGAVRPRLAAERLSARAH